MSRSKQIGSSFDDFLASKGRNRERAQISSMSTTLTRQSTSRISKRALWSARAQLFASSMICLIPRLRRHTQSSWVLVRQGAEQKIGVTSC